MKKALLVLTLVLTVNALMPAAIAGDVGTDRIVLGDGSNGILAAWIDKAEDGLLYLFAGNTLGEEEVERIGPILAVHDVRIEPDGYDLFAENEDGQFFIHACKTFLVAFRGGVHRHVKAYEYLPGRFCCEFAFEGDPNLYLWFTAPDAEHKCGDINFGKAESTSFFNSEFGNSFFYAVNNKSELITAYPQLAKANATVKAKKLATLLQGTVPVDGGTYLGYETTKGAAYTIDGAKSNTPRSTLKFKDEHFSFFEGFMLIIWTDESGAIAKSAKLFPENPLPISLDEMAEIFDNCELLSCFP